jgi:hypothetical protein
MQLSETKAEDRSTVNDIHQKLHKGRPMTKMFLFLKEFADPCGNIPEEKFGAVLDRLHLGLNPEEKELVIRRCEKSGAVNYVDFLK